MVTLLLMGLVPSYTSAAPEYTVQGNLVDAEDSGIQDAVVTVTDLDRPGVNYKTTTTDANGDWSVNLGAYPFPIFWVVGDDILVSVAINDEIVEEALHVIDLGVDRLIVNGIWFITSATPTFLWEWNPYMTDYSSAFTSKFSSFKTTKTGDESNEVTLTTNMRFKDNRVFSGQVDPKCMIDMWFYISDSNEKSGHLFVETHVGDHYYHEYEESNGDYDTGWQVLDLEFEIPAEDTDWWCTFSCNARLVIPPHPDTSLWGGSTWSTRAQWMTQRLE